MRLQSRSHRKRGEPVIALINVVFLVLIFVMVTTVIEPVEPFDVELAQGEAGLAAGQPAEIVISADGQLAYQQQTAELETILQDLKDQGVQELSLRADAGLDTSRLFALVRELEKNGIRRVELATARP